MVRSSSLAPTRPSRNMHLGAVTCAAFALAGTCPALGGITHEVTIQPIQVRQNNGQNPANPAKERFLEATRAIWEQAGIRIRFLSFTTLDKTSFLSIDNLNEFKDLTLTPGHAPNGNDNVLNMFFVNHIYNEEPGKITYGQAWGDGRNGIAIADPTFSYANPDAKEIGRIDTLAHEIGHALGLVHTGNTGKFLMCDGESRRSPATVDDIAPNGRLLSQLSKAQIATALRSSFAVKIVPAPGAAPLLALAGLIAARRRRDFNA